MNQPDPLVRVPYYKRPDRKKTDHQAAINYMRAGWTWKGVKYACRHDWEAAVLKYTR